MPTFASRQALAVLGAEALSVAGAGEEAASLYPLIMQDASNGLDGILAPGTILENFAGIAAAAGEQWDTAQEHFESALRQAHEMPDKIAQPEVRRWYAAMLIERHADDDRDKARTLLGEAIEMYRTIGMPKHPEMAEGMLQRIS